MNSQHNAAIKNLQTVNLLDKGLEGTVEGSKRRVVGAHVIGIVADQNGSVSSVKTVTSPTVRQNLDSSKVLKQRNKKVVTDLATIFFQGTVESAYRKEDF